MEAVRYDRYYTYDELTETLKAWAEVAPQLCRLDSIGTSYEGRDIWLVTVTNSETGPDDEKPALLVEANIHSIEVTGCTAALHLLHKLLTEYGIDDKVTPRARHARALCGAAAEPGRRRPALAEHPRYVRSSVRRYAAGAGGRSPGRGPRRRRADSADACPRSERELEARAGRAADGAPRPDEFGGEYWRVLLEGSIRNYDGVQIKIPGPPETLDLNRNSRANGGPEAEQRGSGPYPASEPEIRAIVQAMIDGRTCAHLSYHTFSGVHLRPFGLHPDDHFPTGDLRAYQQVGEVATRLTGYPAVSVFHEFAYAEAGDQGDVRRLLLRPARDLLLDDGVLVSATPGRHHRLQVHRLDSRPSAGGRPQAAALVGREARRSGVRGLVRAHHPQLGRESSSAVGTRSTRGRTCRSSSSRPRSRRTRTSRSSTA